MESIKKFYDIREKEIKDAEVIRQKKSTKDGKNVNKLFYFVQVFVDQAKNNYKTTSKKRAGVGNIDQFNQIIKKIDEEQIEGKKDRLGAILSVKLVFNNDY